MPCHYGSNDGVHGWTAILQAAAATWQLVTEAVTGIKLWLGHISACTTYTIVPQSTYEAHHCRRQ